MLTNQVSHDIDMLLEVRNGYHLKYFEKFWLFIKLFMYILKGRKKIRQSLLILLKIIYELGLWCLTPLSEIS